MSLMHLLAVGRTFEGSKDGPAGYKFRQGVLPNFRTSVRPRRELPDGSSVQPRAPEVEPAPGLEENVKPAEPDAGEVSAFAVSEARNSGVEATEITGFRNLFGGNSPGELPPVASATETMDLENMPMPAAIMEDNVRSEALDAVEAPPSDRLNDAETAPANPFVAAPPVARAPALVNKPAIRTKSSLFDRLFRRQQRNGRMVQTEWSLERIAVVRNDLSDSDLELVPRPVVIPPKRTSRTRRAGRVFGWFRTRLFGGGNK